MLYSPAKGDFFLVIHITTKTNETKNNQMNNYIHFLSEELFKTEQVDRNQEITGSHGRISRPTTNWILSRAKRSWISLGLFWKF